MQRRRYDTREDEFIREKYKVMTDKEIAEKLDRPWRSIKSRRRILDLLKPVAFKSWTEAEQEFLIENHKTMSDGDIGKALGRTENSVLHRRQRIGLMKNGLRPSHIRRIQHKVNKPKVNEPKALRSKSRSKKRIEVSEKTRAQAERTARRIAGKIGMTPQRLREILTATDSKGE